MLAFEITVDASSVDVIADRLAGHVKSDKFLDVENYPRNHIYLQWGHKDWG